MTQALFEAESGFRDDNVWYLSGEGAPNGTRADDAPVGSGWKDKLSGDSYTKETTGWRKLATGGDTQALTEEVQRIEDAVGLNSDGTYTAIAGANYATGTTIKQAVTQLDTQLKTTQTDLDTLEASFATYQTTQDARDNTLAIATEKSRAEGVELGLRTDLTAAQVLLADARTEKEVAAVTTPTVIDSVLVDSIESAKWIVTVRGTGANAAKKQVVEVLAIHNGTAVDDAVACDFNVYGKLRLGAISGLKVSVELDGSGAGQTMQLKVQSTDEVQVASIREVLFF